MSPIGRPIPPPAKIAWRWMAESGWVADNHPTGIYWTFWLAPPRCPNSCDGSHYGRTDHGCMNCGRPYPGKQPKGDPMLHALKTFDPDGSDLDELISLAAHAAIMASAYNVHEIEVPEWFRRKEAALDREIRRRRHDEIEHQLAETQELAEALKTTKHKRAEAAKRIEELQAKLKE